MTTATRQAQIINGIDVNALRDCQQAIREDSAVGQTQWRVSSTWKGGTRTDHAVDGVSIGGQEIDRRFSISIDEPCELGGTNRFANPQEYLMSAINACMMVGYAATASVMGVSLTKLEVELEGDIDLRGFLGIDKNVKPGYDKLRQTVRIAGDGTPEQFAKMHQIVRETSPNYFNITTAIPVKSELVVE